MELHEMKLEAEIEHIKAATAKLYAETRWYPLVVATGLVVAIVTITKLFL